MSVTKKPTTSEEVLEMSGKYNFYTWSTQKDIEHMAIKGAEGCYFWDFEGNKYFDGASQLVNVNIGFQNKKVIEAIKEQADELCYVQPVYATAPRAVLGKKIIEDIAPKNMGKVLFTLGGADANEYAIRLANVYTGRYKIMSQYMSYHGSTYGAANLNGQEARGTVDPGIAGFIHFFGPNWLDHGLNFESEEDYSAYMLRMLERQILQEGSSKIAAIFVESIQGGGGAVMMPVSYMQGVRKLCDKYGILLVCDEVMVGFGRTGKWFACEHYGIEPDMISFAKGSTSGYTPLGGLIVSKEIAEYFDKVSLPAGLTYNAHPICCAAALATIQVYEDENLIENSTKMGERLLKGLKELEKKHKSIMRARGIGLHTCVDFVGNVATMPVYSIMKQEFQNRGVIPYLMPPRLVLSPPLIVTPEEIDMLLKATDEVLTIADEYV
jgi:taurine---2-oxoglutarate transaminase